MQHVQPSHDSSTVPVPLPLPVPSPPPPAHPQSSSPPSSSQSSSSSSSIHVAIPQPIFEFCSGGLAGSSVVHLSSFLAGSLIGTLGASATAILLLQHFGFIDVHWDKVQQTVQQILQPNPNAVDHMTSSFDQQLVRFVVTHRAKSSASSAPATATLLPLDSCSPSSSPSSSSAPTAPLMLTTEQRSQLLLEAGMHVFNHYVCTPAGSGFCLGLLWSLRR